MAGSPPSSSIGEGPYLEGSRKTRASRPRLRGASGQQDGEEDDRGYPAAGMATLEVHRPSIAAAEAAANMGRRPDAGTKAPMSVCFGIPA